MTQNRGKENLLGRTWASLALKYIGINEQIALYKSVTLYYVIFDDLIP